MQSVKEKLRNMASSVKERVAILKAKVEEKVDKKKAEKSRKGEASAQAKKELHQPVGKGTPLCGGTIPAYPVGGYRPGHKY